MSGGLNVCLPKTHVATYCLVQQWLRDAAFMGAQSIRAEGSARKEKGWRELTRSVYPSLEDTATGCHLGSRGHLAPAAAAASYLLDPVHGKNIPITWSIVLVIAAETD